MHQLPRVPSGYGFLSLRRWYSTSECAQRLCFAEEENYMGQSESRLTTATLLQWCGNVKSLALGMCIHDCSIKNQVDGDSSLHGKLIQMYSRCGDLDAAHALFLLNTHLRNVFIWNVMIRAYAHLGKYQMAFALFNQMLCEGTLPDNFTIVCVITACSCQVPLYEGQRLHARMMVDVPIMDNLVINALLNMYSKRRSLKDVKKIFNDMPEHNIVAWTAMIDALLQHVCRADALQFLGHMQVEGVLPDRIFMLSIISGCTESAAFFEGRKMHVSVLEMGYGSNIFLRTALVSMYGNCGVLGDARKVFVQPFEKNVALWNSFISLHAQFSLDVDASSHLNRMLQEGVLPDRVTFLHGLSACANKADVVEGIKIHMLALNAILGSDVMLGTSITHMYGKCGHLDAAWQVFQQLHERTVISWNVMLGILTQHGEFLKAFYLFGTMHKQGVFPDNFTFVHILDACPIPAFLTEGEQLHNYIVELGLESDVVLGTALMSMYGRCSSLAVACRMFEEMPEHNLVSWNTIILVHVQRGKCRDALRIFTQMLKNEISPDNSTLSSIIDGCVAESLLGEAVFMHAYAVESGYDLDDAMGISLITMYGKLGNVQDAVWVFKMVQVHDALSWTALLTVYMWSGNYEEALELYLRMEMDGVTAAKAMYLVVLEACANLSESSRGEEVFLGVTKKGLDLDAAVATALVNLYGKCGSLCAGKRVFDSIPDKDVILWTAMITTYAQNGFGTEAVCLFTGMQDSGLTPNNVTFVNMLTACSHAGLVHEGYRFLASMMWDYSLSPLVDHYDCAIDLFGRAGLLDEAEHLINRMPFLPRIISFMALLGACRCQADFERGARIAKRVLDLDLEITSPYVMFANLNLTEGMSEYEAN
ncbi:hypothetical protein GOP47_0010979 [Adiantum capillus-veneris]|uniref:Pentatricopeptide repeat-containing protein n=1 Tax=Adiantum capillus-veneris TaxID=13818 RepID=A0A9D4UWW9_ADICA|nr:hypothetical protein GOP47_0010979 [Adiantum capillus-veneris]